MPTEENWESLKGFDPSTGKENKINTETEAYNKFISAIHDYILQLEMTEEEKEKLDSSKKNPEEVIDLYSEKFGSKITTEIIKNTPPSERGKLLENL